MPHYMHNAYVYNPANQQSPRKPEIDKKFHDYSVNGKCRWSRLLPFATQHNTTLTYQISIYYEVAIAKHNIILSQSFHQWTTEYSSETGE